MAPAPHDDRDEAASDHTEGQRATRAVLLGAALGAILAALARGVSR